MSGVTSAAAVAAVITAPKIVSGLKFCPYVGEEARKKRQYKECMFAICPLALKVCKILFVNYEILLPNLIGIS